MDNHFPPRWDTYNLIATFVFVISAIVAFTLSYRCYDDADDTPVGLRILFALLAAFWNILYIIYYFLTVHVGGMTCGGSSRDQR
jgi:hypothetical protein